MSPVTIPLRSSIQAHGQTISEITLRPMTGRDMRTAGFPFTFGEAGERTLDMQAICRHIALLANIPPSSVDLLSPSEMTRAANAVIGFTTDSGDNDEPAQAAGQPAA